MRIIKLRCSFIYRSFIVQQCYATVPPFYRRLICLYMAAANSTFPGSKFHCMLMLEIMSATTIPVAVAVAMDIITKSGGYNY